MTDVFLTRSLVPIFPLLASESVSDFGDSAVGLAIRYGWYLLVIFAGLLLLALVKRRSRRNLTPEAVKQRCALLVKRLEEAIAEDKKDKKNIFNATKAMKLRSLAEEAMWRALRLVEERKDMVFEGVANGLDGVANLLSDVSDDTFAGGEETEKQLRAALEKTKNILLQVEEIIAARKG